MKQIARTNDPLGLKPTFGDPTPERHVNGRSLLPDRMYGGLQHRPTRRCTGKEVEFAKAGLEEMSHLVEEAMRMDERLEQLQPRFNVAAMQKAWFVMIAYFIGSLGLLFSILWGGWPVIFVRIGIAGVLLGLYFVPVHLFVSGSLREDARLVRELDSKSLDYAKKAAKIGRATTRALRRNG